MSTTPVESFGPVARSHAAAVPASGVAARRGALVAAEQHVAPVQEAAAKRAEGAERSVERARTNAKRAHLVDAQLRFRVDETTGRTVRVLEDAATGQVLRQTPSEDWLRVAHQIEKHLDQRHVDVGSLLSDEA